MPFRPRRLIIILSVCFLGFIGLLMTVVAGVTSGLDSWVALQVQAWWTPPLTETMIMVTTVYRPLVLGGIAVCLGICLVLRRRWYNAIPALLGVAGGAFLVLPIKDLVHRLRPETHLISESGFSFPSDHATVVMLFCGFLLFLLIPQVTSRGWRGFLVGVSVFLLMLVSFTRIYLGVHWFSDILGGWLLGAGWLCISMLLRGFFHSRTVMK